MLIMRPDFCGVVDDDVEPTAFGNNLFQHGLDLTGAGNIHFEGDGARGMASGLPRLRLIQVRIDNAAAVGRETVGDGLADAARRSGDQADLSG
jgi:hypothetical protein